MSHTPVTIIDENTVASVSAEPQGDDLWLTSAGLKAALGWELKPEGLCRGASCIPVPPARHAEFVRADGGVNAAALARQRGQAVVHDEAGTVWVFSRSGESRATMLRSLQAPDFALPDLLGRMHRLSDARGKKVLLASWASW